MGCAASKDTADAVKATNGASTEPASGSSAADRPPSKPFLLGEDGGKGATAEDAVPFARRTAPMYVDFKGVESPSLSCKAAAVKHIGYGPLKPENQDEYFVQTDGFASLDHARLFGIFDGHGQNGGVISEGCRQILPVLLAHSLEDLRQTAQAEVALETIGDCLSKAFTQTEANMKEAGVDLRNSGTTASVAYLCGHHLWVASVGDSRAVLCQRHPANAQQQQQRQGQGQAKQQGQSQAVAADEAESSARDGVGGGGGPKGAAGMAWRAMPLTNDHRPKRHSECSRLEAAGGRVEPKKLKSGRAAGEPRLWLQDQPMPGILLSRSIGDEMATSVGCTAKPEITYRRLRPHCDIWLVLASDGIWDVLSNAQVCDIVSRHDDPQAACDALLEASLDEWQERVAADNISVVAVRFHWSDPSLSPLPQTASEANSAGANMTAIDGVARAGSGAGSGGASAAEGSAGKRGGGDEIDEAGTPRLNRLQSVPVLVQY